MPDVAGSAQRDVFVSHSSSDREFAIPLVRALEEQGLTCWLAPRDIAPGEPYAAACSKGIEESERFLLLASSAAIASPQVLAEVEQAHKQKRPIFTVLLAQPKISRELDFYISRLHWLESAGADAETLGRTLAKAMRSRETWETVGTRPSPGRTLRYRRDVAMVALTAAFAAAAVVALGVLAMTSQLGNALDADYRRLGFLAAEGISPAASDSVRVRLRAWLFRQDGASASLTVVVDAPERAADSVRPLVHRLELEAVETQLIELIVPGARTSVTTCLSVRSGDALLGTVQQHFTHRARSSGDASLFEVGQPHVVAACPSTRKVSAGGPP